MLFGVLALAVRGGNLIALAFLFGLAAFLGLAAGRIILRFAARRSGKSDQPETHGSESKNSTAIALIDLATCALAALAISAAASYAAFLLIGWGILADYTELLMIVGSQLSTRGVLPLLMSVPFGVALYFVRVMRTTTWWKAWLWLRLAIPAIAILLVLFVALRASFLVPLPVTLGAIPIFYGADYVLRKGLKTGVWRRPLGPGRLVVLGICLLLAMGSLQGGFEAWLVFLAP